MKRQQRTNDKSFSGIVILTIVLVISIFFLIRIQLPLKALAENSSNANLTGKTASQSAESLMRSIIDPQSIISSILNKTRNNPTTSTAFDNIKNATSMTTSNRNITLAKQFNDNALPVAKKNNETTMERQHSGCEAICYIDLSPSNNSAKGLYTSLRYHTIQNNECPYSPERSHVMETFHLLYNCL